MRISEMLNAMASWLENPHNEALLLAEYDDHCLRIVAQSCVDAALTLKKAAIEVDNIEPPEQSKITNESLTELVNIANAFDSSGDDKLKRQASVIDELLLTIAAPPINERRVAEDYRLEELIKKYQEPTKYLAEANKITDAKKAINKSNMTKQYEILETPLSTRYCPDHPGAQIARIGEHVWQCELDKKSYNFETGFELNNGSKVPGGDVANQTHGLNAPSHAIFDSRQDRLQTNI